MHECVLASIAAWLQDRSSRSSETPTGLMRRRERATCRPSTCRFQSKPPTATNDEYVYSSVSSLITSITGVTADVQLRPMRSKSGSSQPTARTAKWRRWSRPREGGGGGAFSWEVLSKFGEEGGGVLTGRRKFSFFSEGFGDDVSPLSMKKISFLLVCGGGGGEGELRRNGILKEEEGNFLFTKVEGRILSLKDTESFLFRNRRWRTTYRI